MLLNSNIEQKENIANLREYIGIPKGRPKTFAERTYPDCLNSMHKVIKEFDKLTSIGIPSVMGIPKNHGDSEQILSYETELKNLISLTKNLFNEINNIKNRSRRTIDTIFNEKGKKQEITEKTISFIENAHSFSIFNTFSDENYESLRKEMCVEILKCLEPLQGPKRIAKGK